MSEPRVRDLRPGKLKGAVGDAPVVPLFLLGAGMYLAWFGVHYWKSDVKWPTDPVKAVLQGKPLPAADKTPTQDEAAVLAAAREQATVNQDVGGVLSGILGKNPVTGQPSKGQAAGQNQHVGQLLAASYGWGGGQQWDDLVKLWNQESGWNNRAENASSGAYGIPQALPYSKMPKAAWPERYGGRSDPTAQITWGLAYIRSRYGSPSAAWAHEVSNNWY